MGIFLKKVELESFIKSFLLFFISLSSLTAIIFYESYENKLYLLEENLFSQMKIASYEPSSSNFKVNNTHRTENKITNVFNINETEIFVFFEVKNSQNQLIKVSYPLKSYLSDEKIILNQAIIGFLKSLLGIFIISILFSLYALYPLKKSLVLTNEFIKDILHDFNTPLSTIRLNTSILTSKTENKNLKRIQSSVETILSLQNNLKEYLEQNIKESENFDIQEIVYQRVDYINGIYPHINFQIDVNNKDIYCYKDGFIRILDNILSNACKYNKQDGLVIITFNKDNILEIKDTGIGIKNPKKIFNRFYKETSRGLGIGLHIVKKLYEKMNINITVDSKPNKGSSFKLNLSKLILN